MNITLEQKDVEKALGLYLNSMGVTAAIDTVEFKAGRKGTGLKAFLELADIKHTEVEPQPCTVADQIPPEVLADTDTVTNEDPRNTEEEPESLFG